MIFSLIRSAILTERVATPSLGFDNDWSHHVHIDLPSTRTGERCSWPKGGDMLGAFEGRWEGAIFVSRFFWSKGTTSTNRTFNPVC